MPGFNIPTQGAGAGKGGPRSTIESVRTHRWSVKFTGFGDAVLYALSCQRPAPEIDTIKIHNGQTEINAPGKLRWAPINIKFYEVDLGEGGITLYTIFKYWSTGNPIRLSENIIGVAGGFGGYRTATLSIDLEDGEGGIMHKYTLFNAWPSKVEPSELVYTNSDLATTQVTFVYDAANEEKS